MKLPSEVYSHTLGRGVALTPQKFQDHLLADQALGYCGAVILTDVIDTTFTPADFVRVLKDTGMKAIVCGFLGSSGPNPLVRSEMQAAYTHLERAAKFAAAFAEVGCGPAKLIGPMHTKHRTQIATWDQSAFEEWLKVISGLHKTYGHRILFEPLNPTEDGFQDPFTTIPDAILNDRDAFGIHLDLAHFHSRKLNHVRMSRLAELGMIGHIEITNVGRWPLDVDEGIDYEEFFRVMTRMTENKPITLGVEPFCGEVIETFDLRTLCNTKVEGPEALERDAGFLRRNEIMIQQ